jgi:hypothetical protein
MAAMASVKNVANVRVRVFIDFLQGGHGMQPAPLVTVERCKDHTGEAGAQRKVCGPSPAPDPQPTKPLLIASYA